MKPIEDLITLSDYFRRSAHFENNDAVAELVVAARKFSSECTWIDVGYPPETEISRKNIRFLSDTLDEMVAAGKKSGLQKIVLPLHKDSPFAQFVQQYVIDKNEYGLRIDFRNNEYDLDLSHIGAISADVKTILDEGLRGLCAIDSSTKFQWDAELRGLEFE